MSREIRIGIVGSGFAANFHYHAYQAVTKLNVKVVGVYSPTKVNREKFAQKYDIKSFDTFEDMLREVDVIDNCTAAYVHEKYTVQGANAGKHVIVEKPFTGYFGPSGVTNGWRGDTFPKEDMLKSAMDSCQKMMEAANKNKVLLMYAENWCYAPSIQKEREILEKTKGQILWIIGEASHSGSHSPFYGIWSKSGGGSAIGKGCHPLTAALYLKQVDGNVNNNQPIRPKSVSARMHTITRNKGFRDKGFLRTDYFDIEDYAQMHIVFDDEMVADIFSTELVMGGVHNWLEVFANNHRMRANINPVDACVLYNPKEEQFKDVYIVEKIGTKQGWSFPSADEDWSTGYKHELQDFMECVAYNRTPVSGAILAVDTIATIYSAYLSSERNGQEVIIPHID